MDVTGAVPAPPATPPVPEPSATTAPSATADALAAVGRVASTLWQGATYAARTVGAPAGLRGLAVETAYIAFHVGLYPWGMVDQVLQPAGTFAHHRTDTLPPGQRSLIVSDMAASTTPVLLVHGIIDNRSIFALLARALRNRGFGVVHAVNVGVLATVAGDVRSAAREIGNHVEALCAVTGSDRVHVVGHSLGGLMARYYVQRLGGDRRVDTLVTLGSPHRGSEIARLLPPTTVPRQLTPGSDLLAELDEPAPGCRTQFVAVWSRQDQLILPQRNARLQHADLDVTHVELDHVGHLAMTADPDVVHTVARLLGRRRGAGASEPVSA